MTNQKQTRRLTSFAAILASFLAIAILTNHLQAIPADHGGGTGLVVRVYYEDIRDVSRLAAYDVWEYNNAAEGYVLAAVDAAGYDRLRAEGWRAEIDDAATETLGAAAGRPAAFAGGYRTVDELYADLTARNAAHPDLTELVTYGQSHCLASGGCTMPGGDTLAGYPLQAIRITNEAVAGSSTISGDMVARGSKPVFFLMANIHAREITTPELAMRFLDGLLEGYGVDADITWLVDWHEIWIVPTVNPDGHWLVELGERPEQGGQAFYQRKNLNRDVDGDEIDDCPVWPPEEGGLQFGVDLNRNHSFGWGGEGSSAEPCAMVYRGPAPASENEVAQLEALVRALIPDQRGESLTDAAPDDTTGLLISLHSFSDLVLWPWGHVFADAPNKLGLKAIGDKFAFYNGYVSCQPTDWGCLYPAAGASDDWAYGELGIPAYTFEIGDQFMPAYSEVEGQWQENRLAFLYAAKIARTPYRTVRGPDMTDITVTGIGPTLKLTATASDEHNGAQPVATAIFYLDTPPWQEGAQPVPLIAVDAFGEPVVAVLAAIDTAGLLPGRHVVYTQAQDDDGNWGPISAAFFNVSTEPVSMVFVPSILRQ